MGRITADAEAEVLRRNSAIADEYSATARAILSAQTEEFILHMSEIGDNLTPAEVARAFATNFGKRIICRELLEICKRLCSKKDANYTPNYCTSVFETVAYTDNIYSSAAAKKLCPDTANEHFSDFRSACEAVFYEKCDCCLLPMCGTEDGFFPTFFKLIKAYELKIQKVCTVEKSADDTEIIYALLCRNVDFSFGERFVFSFADMGDKLSLLLGVLGEAGCQPAFIYSFPDMYSTDMTEYTVCIRLSGLTAPCLDFFLEAVLPSHTVVGVY